MEHGATEPVTDSEIEIAVRKVLEAVYSDECRPASAIRGTSDISPSTAVEKILSTIRSIARHPKLVTSDEEKSCARYPVEDNVLKGALTIPSEALKGISRQRKSNTSTVLSRPVKQESANTASSGAQHIFKSKVTAKHRIGKIEQVPISSQIITKARHLKTSKHFQVEIKPRLEATASVRREDLQRQLKDSINSARCAISLEATSEIHRAYETAITVNLADAKINFSNLQREAEEIRDELFLPLAEEQILLTRTRSSNNQNPERASTTKPEIAEKAQNIVTLGAQIARFQSELERNEAKLDSLWKEWDWVQAKIRILGENVLGYFPLNAKRDGRNTEFEAREQIPDESFGRSIKSLEEELLRGLTSELCTAKEFGGTIVREMVESEEKIEQTSKAKQRAVVAAFTD